MIVASASTTHRCITKIYQLSNRSSPVFGSLLSILPKQCRNYSIVNIDARWCRSSAVSLGNVISYRQYQPKPTILMITQLYSTDSDNEKKQFRSALTESDSRAETQLSTARKVAKAGKDASYFGVILIGFGITGILFWSVFRELFSSNSANNIYSHTLKLVKSNQQVIDALGTPITAHGDQSGRNRYRNISSQEYIVDDVNYMRVRYYINGTRNKGTVHVDLKEVSRGNYEYRYILVELTGYQRGTIMVEDNR
ncbi:Mitochondrial import inner membrane translocase subunit Tim21 [Trichoplax sp. H2]|nr:Mitochondrial import inner membrane translocase subunit Tim21 [Trichoplax sp. H2]|eukprot:RDD46922.1 Mitochondrial import inner membrane translocase subunit Tim21 [Trichoplax sp. H2]